MPTALILAVLALLPLAGCSHAPATVHVSATAAADLNPGPSGSAFPAQVRLYLLRAPEKFSNADYFQLYDHEDTVFGGDLLHRDEIIMHPRESRVIELSTQPEAKFVGVAVAYRNVDGATWRAIAPARGNLRMTLAANRVTLAPE